MACTAPCSSVDILDERAFETLAEEWDALLQRSYDNRIFLTPSWFRLWWQHFGRGAARVLTLRADDGGLEALLPLQIEGPGGERVLSIAGDWNVADYMDAVADRRRAQRSLLALWRCALTELEWERVELRHIPSASPLIPSLQAAAATMGLTVDVREDEVCPVAILCSSWDGYLEMLGKKQRHEIRRKLRRAQEGVQWKWRTVSTLDEVERDLPSFFQLHEASTGEKERFMTPSMRAYFQSLTASFLERGWLRLSIFSRGGVDVAATLSFVYRQRYLLYNSGYDPAQAAHSPGIAAVALTMQDAIRERAVALDFLSGDEPYKYQFGASNTTTSRMEISR